MLQRMHEARELALEGVVAGVRIGDAALSEKRVQRELGVRDRPGRSARVEPEGGETRCGGSNEQGLDRPPAAPGIGEAALDERRTGKVTEVHYPNLALVQIADKRSYLFLEDLLVDAGISNEPAPDFIESSKKISRLEEAAGKHRPDVIEVTTVAPFELRERLRDEVIMKKIDITVTRNESRTLSPARHRGNELIR